MPLPSKTDLSTLDYAYQGAPFVNVEAKPLATASLDVAYQGAPFAALAALAQSLNVYVRASGLWNQATALFVNVSGTWKSVTTLSVNAAGTWKT